MSVTRILRSMVFSSMVVAAALTSVTGCSAKSEALQPGDKAPDFTLHAQDGTDVSLQSFKGKKNVVLYFYPKDGTMICTKEACTFRDSYQAFTEAGAELLGVSSDDQKSHEDFAGKNHLQFKLLSDPDGVVRKLYGIPKTAGVVPGRVTFVIDKDGVIRLTFNSQRDAEKHVTEALRELKELDAPKSGSDSDPLASSKPKDLSKDADESKAPVSNP